MSKRQGEVSTVEPSHAPGGAYGVQVLIAGRHKHWRDDVAAQIRRAGYAATTVDCGLDAMTVLALGLPVDVLVTERGLQGELCCDKLVREARVLRPDLPVVFASDLSRDLDPDRDSDPDEATDDQRFVALKSRPDAVAFTVQQALAVRA